MLGSANGKPLPQYDLLLLTVTETEQAELLQAATDLGISFQEQPGLFSRSLFDFGQLEAYRVAAIRSRMGALDFGGSATTAQLYRTATSATGIIAVGMAFGISEKNQALGDVLVSEGLFPYDDRDVVSINGVCEYRYEDIEPATGTIRGPDTARGRQRAKFRRAKPPLIAFFRRHARAATGFKVHFGALLSGSARVHCRAYRDMLYNHFSARGKPIVGGEMEAVGLLSCSDPNEPWWVVVKGICDFGDENRDAVIASSRTGACRNAARFVLESLRQSTSADKL